MNHIKLTTLYRKIMKDHEQVNEYSIDTTSYITSDFEHWVYNHSDNPDGVFKAFSSFLYHLTYTKRQKIKKMIKNKKFKTLFKLILKSYH